MLQNDPVRNLHFDNAIRVAQRSPSEPTVFDGPVSITSQPRPEPVEGMPRIPLPIATVAEGVIGNRTYVPKNGYDYLLDVPSVHIEQSFELSEDLTSVSSENRYIVRSPLGDAIYAASESSTQTQRSFCGAARAFQMHLLDKTYQEAMVFRRNLAMGSWFCQPKTLEVWVSPGKLLGRVIQSPTILSPEFFIEDANIHQPIFCIEGPKNSGCCCFCLPKESFFKVHSGGDLRASIDHKWLATKSQFTTNIYFSDSKLTAKERALILGAGFLLEYLYFQSRF